jgi:hypothetical protein
MSYSVNAYLVELGRLCATYGSHDYALVQAIQRHCADRIAFHNEWADRAPVSLVQALQEIIDGDLHHPDHAYQYAYALEMLCRYLGETLPNEEFVGLRSPGLVFIQRLRGLDFSQRPLPIPELPVPGDGPDIGYVTSGEARDFLGDPTLPGGEGTDAYDRAWEVAVQEQYRSWLRVAVDRQMDVVIFLY